MPIPKTVSEINEYIKALIDEEMILQDIYIQGEISNFKNHSSGHLYFTLKDENSEIKAVMFKSYAYKVKFRIENGMKVIAHARISVYAQAGNYQLYVDSIQPDGIGALHLAYEQLKKKLYNEGLFDVEHKLTLPKYPSTIGVITSPTGAAVRDIINVATRRFPYAKIILYPSLVQGEDAPRDLIKAVEFFNNHMPVDVIIIGRGGGSIEDLWAFNDEGLARTIYKSRIPTISGVGHETDFTICDFVADVRAATPSAAAEIATPNTLEIIDLFNGFKHRALKSIKNKIEQSRLRLSNIKKSSLFRNPEKMFDAPKIKLDIYNDKILSSFNLFLNNSRGQFLQLSGKLASLNPMSVLSRGYGAMKDIKNNIIKSINNVNLGDTINVMLSDGCVIATVTDKKGN
ncbi:MAG: exodeoxyribonuclease VII large subunit [Clostridia bacterium]|nr:exodeoxyribonuclease VII large subunit [Clostridia bacterium]